MLKNLMCALAAVLIFFGLKALFPVTGATALVVTALQSWGAFSYAGLIGIGAFCGLVTRA